MSVASPPPVRKKLIEVSIPLEAINAACAKEKSIRHGHPSTIHLWWARRPLAACRAVLFAQLVDDPSAWPDRFPKKEEQDAERKRLHEVIARMVPWEASSDEAMLNEARWEIARSVAWGLSEEPPPRDQPDAILSYLQDKAPPVYDPFSGGGSIPLEAQRLGLRACGSDLNPVAVLIGKALVEIPPKFDGRPPINPDVRGDKRLIARTWKGAQGLANDVRWYGAWLRSQAYESVGCFYPEARLKDGSKAKIIAWIWARTVPSPDPAAKGAKVPLVSSWLLSAKSPTKTWIEPILDPAHPDGYRFSVRSGSLNKDEEKRIKSGTKTSRGANFTCLLTGAAITSDYIKGKGKNGEIGTRMIAVVAEGFRNREFLAPTIEDETVANKAQSSWQPTECLPSDPRAFWTVSYGFDTFASLYTQRQLATLTTLADLIPKVRERVLSDAQEPFHLEGSERLASGGRGAEAYADAVATYLGLVVSGLSDRLSSICTWDTGGPTWGTKVRNTFSRQGLPMTWDFAEVNPFSSQSGSIENNLDYLAKGITALGSSVESDIKFGDAADCSRVVRDALISTDPPYYDNIGYADLSDYFYVWLRPSLKSIWPDLFRRLTTPKESELIASPYRHGGKAEAEKFFLNGMMAALKSALGASKSTQPLAVYYAFKQSELAQEGVTSAGWASFLQAMIDAGLLIDGTWPVRTELANRMIGRDANALASSIVLVCRPRSEVASIASRADFLRELRRELPAAMKEIIAARVGPVDFEQAVIGPGMGVFSQFAKVLEEDDTPMSVRTALALINRVRLEVDAETGNFDPETQVALAWFQAHGDAEKASGEAILLANAKGVSLNALLAAGVFRDGQGKVRLVRRDSLPNDWSPTSDSTATIWECLQHTARALGEGGAPAAAAMIEAMGSKAEDALSLAYRLYDISNARGDASEARVYAELAAEWPGLEALAAKLNDNATARSARAQPSLFN